MASEWTRVLYASELLNIEGASIIGPSNDKGIIFAGDGSHLRGLLVGSDGQVLTADSSFPYGLR